MRRIKAMIFLFFIFYFNASVFNALDFIWLINFQLMALVNIFLFFFFF